MIATEPEMVSMVSEPDADELDEVGDGPVGEIGILGSAGRFRDGAGLDPKNGSDQREMAGNSWGSQKDRLLDLCFQALEEKMAINTREAKDQMTFKMDSLIKSVEDRINDRLDKIMTILEQNQQIDDTARNGKQTLMEISRGESSRNPAKQVNINITNKKTAAELSFREEVQNDRHQKSSLAQNSGGKFLSLPKAPKIDIPVFKGNEDILNWLYQMKYVFSIHDTPIEHRVDDEVSTVKI